jgi:hypothetical protein
MSRRPGWWIGWTTTGCGAAGGDRGHSLLPAHASTGRRSWAAGVGGGADATIGGRDDRGSLNSFAGRLAVGRPGGLLTWALLVTGSLASLAANVAVAEPTAAGRVIAAWPSFALIGSYELLMRQVRRPADSSRGKKRAAWNRSTVGHVYSARPPAAPRRQGCIASGWRRLRAATAGVEVGAGQPSK